MFDSTEATRSERGTSARHLVLVFLACVAVCAVFFSLGYLVGYNERASRTLVTTENVATPAVVPPVVNPPVQAGASMPAANSEPSGTTNVPASNPLSAAPEKPEPLSSSSSSVREPAKAFETHKPAKRTATARRSAVKATAPAYAGAGFSVQVMASRTRTDADSLAHLLRGKGYPAFVLSAQALHVKDHLFRVLVGPYATRGQAEATLKKLEKEGFQPFIKH